jgi:ABC-2 type transport system permease protein
VVAQFLRLKLTLLVNTFRRNPLQLVGMILALLYGLGLATVAAVGLVGLRFATPDIARAIVIVFGAVVVLAFLLLPLTFGVDDSIDPRRFSLFGIPTGRLAFALAVAAFLSVPALIVAIFAVAQIVTWSRGPVPVLVALVAAVIIVPTCVLAARVSAAVAASFLSSRRARDFSNIALVFVLAVAAPLFAVLATADWESQGLPAVRRIAAVVSWTPLGAVWSAPGDAALGHLDTAFAKLGIAVAFLVVLALAWRALVAMMLVRAEREAHARQYSGLGWFEQFPASPLGAIAARSLSYWGRDARYRVAIAAIPVVPIVMVAALLVGGVPLSVIAWIPVPVMCLFLGWTVHNDIAHDSTAFWTHVSANTRGTDDRWGRLIPALVVGIPLILVGSIVTVIISGDPGTLGGLIGLSSCVLLVGLGISSVVSAGFPYPAVHPGDSPFAQPQAAGSTGSVVQSLSFLASLVAAVPVIVFVILGATLSPYWYYAALGAGLLIGVAVLIGGVRWGGNIVAKGAPELLAFTLQN